MAYVSIQKGKMADAHHYATFFAIRSDVRRLPVQAFFDDGFHRPQKIFSHFFTRHTINAKTAR